jgi:hypothetical protein
LIGEGAKGERDVQVTVRRRDIVKRMVLIDFLRRPRTPYMFRKRKNKKEIGIENVRTFI